MPEAEYPTSIWDYLDDMPHMPSRDDRDVLVEAARTDPSKERQVCIWDFFFRIRPSDVGRPQQKRIEKLEQERREAIATHKKLKESLAQAVPVSAVRTKSNRTTRIVAAAIGVMGLLVMIISVAYALDDGGIACAAFFGMLIGVVLLRMSWGGEPGKTVARLSAELTAAEKQLQVTLERYEADVPRLERQLTDLRARIPSPPTADEVHEWLQDDLAWLTQQAYNRSGLLSDLVTLPDAPNPLCILGPAELQEAARIPGIYTKDPSRLRHLQARSFDILQSGAFQDFYGVYYIEFILVGEDILGTYGVVFDFITGRVTGERTSEQYYRDVVAISTRREYRDVQIGEINVPVEDALTFSLSLSSGDRVSATIASQGYINGIRKQLREADGLDEFDPERWATNPEHTADNAIGALRARLRAHKSTSSSRQ